MTPNAFIELLRPHYEDVVRYCRLLCAPYPASAAEDVLQDALTTAFEKIDKLKDQDRFRPWLFRVVQRAFLMERRRQIVRRVLPLSDVDPARQSLYDDYEQLEWKGPLLAALAQLNKKQRETLLLHEVAGFKLREIAAMQKDRSLSATKMRLGRARKRMRELLAQHPPIKSASAPVDLIEETLRIINHTQGGAAND
ncbi:MAG: RNA polymerase sigma factor [Rhodothermales bacterium]